MLIWLELLAKALHESYPFYQVWEQTGNLQMKTMSLVIHDRVINKQIDLTVEKK